MDDRDDVMREERTRDVLVQIAKHRAIDALDPSDPAASAFFDWLATDTRERQLPSERRASARRADAFAERMSSRILAERCGVTAIDGAPEVAMTESSAEQPAPRLHEVAWQARRAPAFDLAVAAGVGRDLWDEPCERWIIVPRTVGRGRYVALTVAGDSMLPLLHRGDVILVRLGGVMVPGSIVVARHPDDGYVVKRVGRVRKRELELVSLNSAYEPIVIPRDPSLVLGVVVLRWRSSHRAA